MDADYGDEWEGRGGGSLISALDTLNGFCVTQWKLLEESLVSCTEQANETRGDALKAEGTRR